MSLAQSIVVVNQFSVKGADGTGSRGSTPGFYVERYIIDDNKNEALWPLSSDTPDVSAARYEDLQNRIMSSDSLSSVEKIASSNRDGVAFSGDSLSLSFDETRKFAKTIQKAFDEGKTVFKTVITFEDDYLSHMGVLEPHGRAGKLGAHKGHVDQLKLRQAVQDGLNSMGSGFDNFTWLASAHLDRNHVHFHVAGVDLGEGRVRYDGQQRGKLGVKDIRKLRSGINDSLQRAKSLQSFYRSPTVEHTRVTNTVRSYVHDSVMRIGTPQLILASLPEDTSLWDISSKHPLMQRPNEIMHDYVQEILSEPDSGFAQAVADIWTYAELFGRSKNLDDEEKARIALRGRKVLEDSCANSVYNYLKRVPDDDKTFESPFMDAMMLDMGYLARASLDDPMSEFGYKVRSYSTRLEYHKRERRRFHNEEERYLATPNVSADSRAAYDFYAFERLYQEQLMSKYQHFMAFLPSDADWRDRIRDVLSLRVNRTRLANMIDDLSIQKKTPDDAEQYGIEKYRCQGASQLVLNPRALDDALFKVTEDFEVAEAKLAFDVAEDGMVLHWGHSGSRMSLSLRHEVQHPFDEVKALDLHKLGYDFPGGVDVSAPNVKVFIECAQDRKDALDDAIDYFRASGQGDAVSALPVEDVEDMWAFAQQLVVGGGAVGTARVGAGGVEHIRTVEISENFEQDTRRRVLSQVAINSGLEQVRREFEL